MTTTGRRVITTGRGVTRGRLVVVALVVVLTVDGVSRTVGSEKIECASGVNNVVVLRTSTEPTEQYFQLVLFVFDNFVK